MSVNELPCFHLQFLSRTQLEQWRRGLLDLHSPDPPSRIPEEVEEEDDDVDGFGTTDDDDYKPYKTKRISSATSSYGAAKSSNTALTEYTNVSSSAAAARDPAGTGAAPAAPAAPAPPPSFHVPLDLVVVIPVSSSTQGLKINLLRETLQFLVHILGPRDRMGLVTFGSSGGGVPLVGMTSRAWNGWSKTFKSIRPVGQKSLRADVVDGANVAMDLLMQRKSPNPLSNILLISDSSTSEPESVDFVVSRAEAAK